MVFKNSRSLSTNWPKKLVVVEHLNDNFTSVLLTGPAVLPILPLAKFNFDILVLRKDPYCILVLLVMPVDVAQKKDDEIWMIESRDLGLLLQKVLPTEHNTSQVVIKRPNWNFTGNEKSVCFIAVPREKSMHTRIAYIHFAICTIFSCKWFYPLSHEKIPLCSAKLPLLLWNNAKIKREKSFLWSNMKNLYMRCASPVFLCYI